MQLPQSITVAYLEEDPLHKALFRLRPLLDAGGIYTEAPKKQFPDDGYLRIVPDRQEQSSFRARMRGLGSLCLIDLQKSGNENVKIRQNKNYSAAKKEFNRYAIYSDVVLPLPSDLVYEVLTLPSDAKGFTPEQEIAFMTPKAYVQRGTKWYGPFSTPPKRLQKEVERPSSQAVFTLSLPDGSSHTLYWAKELQPGAANPAAKPQDESELEIGKPLSILDTSIDFEEQLTRIAQPLSSGANFLDGYKAPPPPPAERDEGPVVITGTPLIPVAPAPVKGPSLKNNLNQVVESKWQASRNTQNTTTPSKGTPATARKKETSVSLTDPAAGVVAAMADQLQTMEGERLALVMQLERAKADMAAFTAEALTMTTAKQRTDLESLKKQVKSSQESLDKLRSEIDALTRQRDNAVMALSQAETMESMLQLGTNNAPLRIGQVPGTDVPMSILAKNLFYALGKGQYDITQDDAVNFILLLALYPKTKVCHPSISESARFIRIALRGLGLQRAIGETDSSHRGIQWLTSISGGSPAVLITTNETMANLPPQGREMLLSTSINTNSDSSLYSVPHLHVPDMLPLTAWPPREDTISSGPTPSLAALQSLVKDAQEVPTECLTFVEEIRKTLADAAIFIPYETLRQAGEYIAQAAKYMDGGVAAAMDFAMAQFVLPLCPPGLKLQDRLTPFLSALPRSRKLLS